jgi:lactate racemase
MYKCNHFLYRLDGGETPQMKGRNSKNAVSIKTGSWGSERELTLTFPDHWEVSHIKGAPLPEASVQAEMRKSFDNPIGCGQLERMLNGKQSVAIVVDDHTRPTPVYDVVTALLDRIERQGIPGQNVKLIVALGTHVLEDKSFLKPKFGDLLDGRVRVVIPDVRKLNDYVHAGTTQSGLPVYIHREYREADVRITVSGIYPHDEAGFSGGAKIMIGLLGLRTLSGFHRKYSETGRGRFIDPPFRHELETYADIAGIDWSVNIVLNHEKKIHKLWCGDFRRAFREAAEYAKSCLGVEKSIDADVIISNAYPLDTSLSVAGKSMWPFRDAPKTLRRILIASPVTYSDFRVPFCESSKEAMYQMVKRLTGLSRIKRMYEQRLLGEEIKKDEAEKWTHDFVYFTPYPRQQLPETGAVLWSHYVFSSSDSLMRDLVASFPEDKKVAVALYDYAPLHFPLT